MSPSPRTTEAVGTLQWLPPTTKTPSGKSATMSRMHPNPTSVDSSVSRASGNSDFKSRFKAYNRLQAVAFGEKLPIPVIVSLGGQSDGKSSLIEALLGFRFNVREVEMGTRRPLILQMVHDPTALDLRCRFQEEDSDEYGSPVVLASTIADIIKSRTDALLKKTKTAVSPKSIVMRAEYAHCPNLTIIDTPGFVLKAKKVEPENTPEETLSMVKSLASPPHRFLVFLQQSSVEWCSSVWLDAIREIDPTFRRTVTVVSKFDNRLKIWMELEFSDRWEVDRYWSARDLAKQCKLLVRHHLDLVTSPYSQVCYGNDFQEFYSLNAPKFNQASASSFFLELSDTKSASHDEMSEQENIPPEKNAQGTTLGNPQKLDEKAT